MDFQSAADVTKLDEDKIDLITEVANNSAALVQAYFTVRGLNLDILLGDETHGDLTTIIFDELARAVIERIERLT